MTSKDRMEPKSHDYQTSGSEEDEDEDEEVTVGVGFGAGGPSSFGWSASKIRVSLDWIFWPDGGLRCMCPEHS